MSSMVQLNRILQLIGLLGANRIVYATHFLCPNEMQCYPSFLYTLCGFSSISTSRPVLTITIISSTLTCIILSERAFPRHYVNWCVFLYTHSLGMTIGISSFALALPQLLSVHIEKFSGPVCFYACVARCIIECSSLHDHEFIVALDH
ncbi:hypothetical protein J3R30DRAFT_849049 [Lentinula aciculospora]|uniref:Uncharacterized protein n=1 Tax=Lentinula aciculospora TaxID=153920 RepID=A0A9W9DV15_9AGAR|nr:hypothetical protein J3R30DRAFT_849049 [Lentinula aciculospora]